MRRISPGTVGIAVGILVMCGAIIWVVHGRRAQAISSQGSPAASSARVSSETKPAAKEKKKKTSITLREVSLWDTNTQQRFVPPKLPADSTGSRAAPGTLPPTLSDSSAAHARDLVSRLTQLTSSGNPLTHEQADEINKLLTQLAGDGTRAIPAIREFLQMNLDYNYDQIQGGDVVNYKTLRLGLLDTMQQIGGAGAIELSASTLQTTTDPSEVALLSRYLEEQTTGQFRNIEVTAARQVLAQAATGQESYGDMSPVFEVLQAYGDTNVVNDLEKAASRWNYYATLALAGLTNGAGIPSLIKLAQDPAVGAMGPGDFALRPLAQAALQYPNAASALVDIARQNQIPDTAWQTVSLALAGSYIQYGNQIFGSTSPNLDWSDAQIRQRMAVINQLLAVTSSPTGRQALQDALASLSNRLPK